ncbi:MAG TPA: hypothetical protein VLF95_04615, partial [Vicinamibacteria bacterium]|nr:hypothetical protein [Vicinamibacteria bacterium]
TESDVAGVALPSGSRSSAAFLVRSTGGRLVVRAAGPGLLVLAEGWDAGWTAAVDGREARVLRVNGDRVGVVLPEGNHRVLLAHRARGLGTGIALATLAAAALAVALLAGRRRN